MQNSNLTDAEDLRVYQIIDANLDRAREGLRVLEDWARFGIGGNACVTKIKNFIFGGNKMVTLNYQFRMMICGIHHQKCGNYSLINFVINYQKESHH